MEQLDLNTYSIDNHDGPSQASSDYSTESSDGKVQLYLRDLASKLIEHIHASTLIVGCVAWLTNSRILQALSEVQGGVALVVQKEDFLRPDLGVSNDWRCVKGFIRTPPQGCGEAPLARTRGQTFHLQSSCDRSSSLRR